MNKEIVYLVIVSILLIALQSCTKDTIEISGTTEFEDFLQEEMEDQNIPAMSVLIFEEDNILYETYLGQSNIQEDIALANNHLFLLASVSKVVTATALLQLYEDGLFELDDPINDYLPFNVNIPNHSTPISFRMLLAHTSGIEDGSALDDQYYYGEDSPLELASFLENYLTPSGSFYDEADNFYDFSPGSEHEYSNVGNALIAVLVENIATIDFNTYCIENIFSPLGMNNTHWRLDEISQTIVQPYDYVNGDYEAIQHYTFTDYPNGGLRSTGNDLFTFLSAFVHNGISNNYELLKPNTIEDMLRPQIPNIDDEVGLHLFVMDNENNLWGHDGGEQGVATIMAFNPDTKIGAIILSNQGEADLDEILAESYKLGLGL